MNKNFTFSILFILLIFLSASFSLRTSAAIVINEVYGAGGNGSATYSRDYVELYNNGTTSVNISGYSLQYAPPTSTTGSFGTCVLPTMGDTTIEPGTYYLIQLGSQNTGVGSSLPTPDATPACSVNSISSLTGGGIGNAGGKLILANDGNAIVILGTGCPATTTTVADFVGYGNANCSETAPAPAPANNQSSIRRNATGTDTNNNSIDFTSGAPTPQASGSTAANATVGGRVTQPNGRGIFRARVTLTDSQGIEQTAYTNQMGFYNFAEIPGGQSYIFSVAHRRFEFNVPSRVEFVGEDNSSINFVSSSEGSIFKAISANK